MLHNNKTRHKYQHTFFTTTINLALQTRYEVCRALSLLLLGKPLVHREQFGALKRYIQQVEYCFKAIVGCASNLQKLVAYIVKYAFGNIMVACSTSNIGAAKSESAAYNFARSVKGSKD
jgi:hypothetical protein